MKKIFQKAGKTSMEFPPETPHGIFDGQIAGPNFPIIAVDRVPTVGCKKVKLPQGRIVSDLQITDVT